MPKTTLLVKDQCNIKFNDLDPVVRRKMCDALKFMIPNARHMPQYKLGRWDGTVSFCTAGGATYLNLLDRVLPIVVDAGYEIEIDDRRPDFSFRFPEITEELFADRCWPPGHPMAGEPILLRDYQVGAIKKFIENPQSVQQLATGSGKTITTAGMSCLCEPYGRTIIIVPNKSLVRQTEIDYRNLGLDTGVLFGERKEYGHRHTIATWQSLASLAKKTRREELDVDINEVVRDAVCVIVDEAHSAKGKELRDLLCGAFAHVPIRWGLTGTIPKEEHEWMCLLSAIGPVVGEIKAADLQERGVLADCHVQVVQLQDDHVEFRDYESEHDFLLSDQDRLSHIAGLVSGWADSGNTLVLVDRIETGEILRDLIPGSVFVSGSTNMKNREIEYSSIQNSDCKVLIATYGVAAVGINLPRLFNLVMVEAGRSFVRCLQSIGRVLRKAKDKDYAMIYDVCSSLKYSSRHLGKRREYYKESAYPMSKSKSSYR